MSEFRFVVGSKSGVLTDDIVVAFLDPRTHKRVQLTAADLSAMRESDPARFEEIAQKNGIEPVDGLCRTPDYSKYVCSPASAGAEPLAPAKATGCNLRGSKGLWDGGVPDDDDGCQAEDAGKKKLPSHYARTGSYEWIGEEKK